MNIQLAGLQQNQKGPFIFPNLSNHRMPSKNLEELFY
jgi:hypothetical protein